MLEIQFYSILLGWIDANNSWRGNQYRGPMYTPLDWYDAPKLIQVGAERGYGVCVIILAYVLNYPRWKPPEKTSIWEINGFNLKNNLLQSQYTTITVVLQSENIVLQSKYTTIVVIFSLYCHVELTDITSLKDWWRDGWR
jgi:hypothetical protein